MKYIIVLSTILIFFLQSCNTAKKNVAICESYKEKTVEFVFNFDVYNDTVALDSALYYIDKGLCTCSNVGFDKPTFSFYKLIVLSKRNDYLEGIEFIKAMELENFNILPQYPYYMSVILKRFYAMQCQYEGDLACRNKYVQSILDEIQLFIAENKDEIDSIGKMENYSDIHRNQLIFTLLQHYIYKVVLHGVDSVNIELDSLKEQGFNPDFIHMIRPITDEGGDVFLFFWGP